MHATGAEMQNNSPQQTHKTRKNKSQATSPQARWTRMSVSYYQEKVKDNKTDESGKMWRSLFMSSFS
jgi:hypothetical protein